MTNFEEELLSDLKKGMAVFHQIPEDIGEIVYCNTTNNKSEPDDEELKKNKIAFSIIIPLLIAGLCWYNWYEHYIICIIVSIICAFISYIFVLMCKDFSGTDYFVGKEGAAVVKFKNNRDNCEVGTIYFRDVEDILTGEHIVMEKRKTSFSQKQYSRLASMIVDTFNMPEYKHTDYFYALYGQENGGQINAIESTTGNYNKNLSEGFLSDQHRFWRMIYKSWYDYKFPQLLSAFENGESIGFNVYKDKYYHNYIMLKGIELSIRGKVFNIHNTEGISFEKGLFNIKSKGNNSENTENGLTTIESIPLHIIANRDMFIYFVKENLNFFQNIRDETDNSNQYYYVQIPDTFDCTFNIEDWKPPFPRENSGEKYNPVWSTPDEIKEMEKELEDEMKDLVNRNYGLPYLPWEDDPRGPLL